MTYEIKFTVGDYTGPMEYYFRGDDDFWLFIDGQRVIDIGGIHAAVGQSIDLRAWMEQRGMLAEDKLQQEHTLKVFYMERGASGSCCYMQFTIPDATPVPTPTVETKDYEVEKKWDDNGNPFRPGSIVVQLQQISDVGGTSTITPTSEMVELSAEKGWKHKWIGLPSINGSTQGEYKYTYSVKEINLPPGYHSEVDENGVLTNTLEPVKVKVKKEWENDSDLKTYRPDSVTLRLYANGEPYTDDKEKSEENPEGYRDITLNEAGGWEGIIENLPEYYYELVSDGTDSSDASGREYNAIPIQYSVREVVNGTVVEEGGTADGKDNSGYVVNYTETEGDNSFAATVTATNALQTSFQIMKKGKVGDEILNPVKGAEFVLTQCDQNGTVSEGAQSYTGRSDENGVVSWKSEEIPKGTYLLEETKSPEGYALSEEKWIITVKDYGRVEIRTGSGEVVDPDSKLENSDGTLVFTYTFCNEVVYKLPSTGGPGIYWYMFGGVLFMAAASLIAYKNKHREVFGK
jgi:fibro-slime domain